MLRRFRPFQQGLQQVGRHVELPDSLGLFGGCRCQAFALTGDARATDPVCHLAPHHARVGELAEVRVDAAYDYRR
jgi:hypothetical protein